ncbi:MAG: polysaccharide biosynthesis/export family protein [Hyphomicrobiaceae bacterium]
MVAIGLGFPPAGFSAEQGNGWDVTLAPATSATEPGPSQETTVDKTLGTVVEVAGRQPSDPDAYTFNAGDRVKLTIYGREDLPSEYRVNTLGQVAIPTIGVFDVLSMTPQDLEIAVRNKIEQSIGNIAFVAVEPMEPIFVTGLVSKPGAYPYSFGMIAIQAVTLAGGTTTATSTDWLSTEAIRETSRMKTSELELIGLTAKRARLTADRIGVDEITPPTSLVELTGLQQAGEIIAREQQILDQDRQAFQRQRQTLEKGIQEAKVEIAAYEDELAYIKKQRKLRRNMLEPLQQLVKKGLTTQQRVTDSELLLVSIERDAQNAIANISRARQSLDRSERDLAILDIDRTSQLDKQIQEVEEQIAKARTNRNGSATFVNYVATVPAESLQSGGDLRVTLEIMRRTKDGRFVNLVADEMTPVKPGDVLRLRAARAN